MRQPGLRTGAPILFVDAHVLVIFVVELADANLLLAENATLELMDFLVDEIALIL